MRDRIRVAVNGYGVIGRRVADAVRLQLDMERVGVADVAADYRIRTAALDHIPVYASDEDRAAAMREAGIAVEGSLDRLLGAAEAVVDCTPKGVPPKNFERYKAVGVKAVFQGGEKHVLTGHSFVAQANYTTALDRDATRVVSCNTTSIVRVLGAIQDAGLLAKARGVLIRRATDPWEADHSGIMINVVPEAHIPSHQGPDAQSVRPELDLVTMAAKAAHTQTHSHYWTHAEGRGFARSGAVRPVGGAAHRLHPNGQWARRAQQHGRADEGTAPAARRHVGGCRLGRRAQRARRRGVRDLPSG